MRNIQLVHIGEDYTKYNYIDEDNEQQEVEITGIAQEIINTLGLALQKTTFVDALK